MGYTTTYTGSFKLDKPLTFEHAAVLKALHDDNEKECFAEVTRLKHPDSYLQWIPTKDRKGIEWDGNEKFYYDVEWLKWLISGVLIPWGYTLNGEVEFQGEDQTDYGVIVVEDNKVAKVECPTVAWSKVPVKRRKALVAKLQDEARNFDFEGDEVKDFNSAMALLLTP